MDFLNDLIAASSSAQLETIISSFDTTLIKDNEQKLLVVARLNEILENEFLANNAKIRRRIKRCVLAFEGGNNIDEDINNNTSLQYETKDLKCVVQSLYKATTVNHVQLALDSVVVPEKSENGEHSDEFLIHRAPLKAALEHVLLDESRTNKVLRKRIKRLVFVLSTKAEQTLLNQISAAKPVKLTSVHVPVKSTEKLEPTIVMGNSKPFCDCFAELSNATSPLEVEKAISDVSVLNSSAIDLNDRVAVHAKLGDLILNQKDLVGNAKVRRMVNRLLDSLTKSFAEVDKLSEKVIVKSSTFIAEKWSVVPEEFISKPITKQASSSTSDNHPFVSKVCPSETGLSSDSAVVVPGGPLEPVIDKVRSVASAVDLEDALLDVKPDSGSCSSRRTLKRAIERLLTQENIKETINAKIRRRITRVISMLEPQAHSERNKVAVSLVESSTSSSSAIKTAPIPNNKIPYVVFIGQLSFTATEQDIEYHLRSHGVEGEISVRLLKKTDSGESRGMAFVELEGARELHKCIALHHSRLQGRVINVEKSCGGKNKTMRTEKIGEKRREQTLKVHESVDKVLLEFQDKGVLNVEALGGEFKDKIHRYTPGFVAECLKIYSSLHPDSRSLGSLDQILTSRDERVRLNNDLKRGAHDAQEDDHFAKKSRVEVEQTAEWPVQVPVGFSDAEQDSRSRRSAFEKGGATVDLRLDQVFSSRRGRGGIAH